MLKNHLIHFEDLPWNEPQKGLKYKAYKNGVQQIRLVEFSEGFIEEDWCCREHAGHVLEGSCSIDFNGSIEYFEAGDTLFISKDIDKHKVIVNQGQRVLMLLFETV